LKLKVAVLLLAFTSLWRDNLDENAAAFWSVKRRPVAN